MYVLHSFKLIYSFGEDGKDFKLFLGNAINEIVARLCAFTCISLAMYAEHKTTKISQFE